MRNIDKVEKKREKKKQAEMEYCASTASMLPEEIWQIVKGFVEVPTKLQAQFRYVEEMFQMINNWDSHS